MSQKLLLLIHANRTRYAAKSRAMEVALFSLASIEVVST